MTWADLLIIPLWIVAVSAAVWLHTFFWTMFYRLRRRADQIHWVTTNDNWNLALHRYLPPKKRFVEPIFLCHGMGANRFNFDLAEDRSLARELCRKGFEVWSLELRGAGQSSKPGWFSPHTWGFDFDDHLEQDIPSALKLVLSESGSDWVYWVGHSMGGMLGYAWLGMRGEHHVKGLVTIASPVLLKASSWTRFFRPLIHLVSWQKVIRAKPVERFLSPFVGWGPALFSRIFVSPKGMEGALLRRVVANMLENTSGALLRQFLTWQKEGTFVSKDGAKNYLENLRRIEEPVLIVGAERDHLATPATLSPAYEKIGSPDKQFRIFGVDRGDDYDFGHGDILLGSSARRIVYPEIVGWLASRATRKNVTNPVGKKPLP
jgi:alpha-beta hydrolase superfamily lysophospholipase